MAREMTQAAKAFASAPMFSTEVEKLRESLKAADRELVGVNTNEFVGEFNDIWHHLEHANTVEELKHIESLIADLCKRIADRKRKPE